MDNLQWPHPSHSSPATLRVYCRPEDSAIKTSMQMVIEAAKNDDSGHMDMEFMKVYLVLLQASPAVNLPLTSTVCCLARAYPEPAPTSNPFLGMLPLAACHKSVPRPSQPSWGLFADTLACHAML